MKCNWSIGFEWLVTGAAVVGVIVLLVAGEPEETADAVHAGAQAAPSSR